MCERILLFHNKTGLTMYHPFICYSLQNAGETAFYIIRIKLTVASSFSSVIIKGDQHRVVRVSNSEAIKLSATLISGTENKSLTYTDFKIFLNSVSLSLPTQWADEKPGSIILYNIAPSLFSAEDPRVIHLLFCY